MIVISNEGWSHNPPPSELQMKQLMNHIPGFPEAVARFLQEHNGAYGDMQADLKPSSAMIYDVDTIMRIFDENIPELCGYLVFGSDLFDEYLVVRLQPDDSPVYSVLALNIYQTEPTEEEIVFDSFRSFLTSRRL